MKKSALFVFTFLSVLAFSQKKWTLQECVNYAVENNLQVMQNQFSRKISDNNLQVSKKQYLPTVSGNINNNVNFGQGRDVFGNSNRNDNFTNSAGVGADILVFNHGRLEKNIRKSEYDVQASQFDLDRVKNDISLQIAQQYLSVLLNREITKISSSALENAEKLYQRAKITTEVGTTSQTVLAEAEAALAREKQNVKTAQINTKRSLFSLAMLLQLPDYKSFDIQDVPVTSALDAPLYSAENIITQAFENQPQIKAAETRIKSAEAQTEITKTAFWPTVSASAGIGTSYFNSLVTNTAGIDINGNPIKESSFFKQYKDNFGQQLGLSASIPIFNKGITRLNVEQSKINEEIAKTTLQQQKQEVLQNVQKAQFDAESNYQAYLAAMEAEKSSKLALDFAEKSYEAGRTTIYDLNIARNNYANAQGSVAQAKYNYLFSMKLLNFYAGIPLSL
ncbi:TolC family protein [Chryseobacterium koreense]|uniref:Transporter n=1 Tax=Chryseobacterium koreense CCUG 49689 TaxID=1304281 RepID=A0A0J7IYW7_9FLAO|nr:TolC family protein [Chryseobacterium koreense]KMQ71438.1 transporter [Chryseobacterium koreense CCUG 49689]MBB5332280.1 outer membrane protein [Chryseobacterium koreense]